MNIAHNKIILVIIGIIGISLAVAWLSGSFEQKIKSDQAVMHRNIDLSDINPVLVTSREISQLETVSGTLVSAKHITVSSRILARIEKVEVKAGDFVTENDLLILLDARDAESQVLQARQYLQAAISTQQLARTEHERNIKLLQQDAASQKAVDQSLAQFRVANAEVERRKRELDEVETRLSYTEIRASVNGRVIDTNVESGDTAQPGVPLLRLYDPNLLRVEVPVRESLAVQLKLGDSLRVVIPSLGLITSAIIDEIVPFAESGARTLLIKLGLPNIIHRDLIAGLYVKVSIPVGANKILTIPSTMVIHIGQLKYVYVLSDGSVSRRMITTGQKVKDNQVEVLSGLQEGDEVITFSEYQALKKQNES